MEFCCFFTLIYKFYLEYIGHHDLDYRDEFGIGAVGASWWVTCLAMIERLMRDVIKPRCYGLQGGMTRGS
jgi:hypothetical protein